MTHNTIIALAAIKGLAMSLTLTVIAETTFLQTLATAIVSAVISGTFLLVSVHMNTRRTDDKIEKVKEKIEETESE
jgi:cell division protein FtsL